MDPEPIFVRDGPIWTSAGVTAGMDLALALVEEDLDRDAALTIARHLVLFLRRPGNQSQFSATLSAQEPAREPLREVQRHVVEHPAADLSVEAMAARALMSPRHFARAFRAETGVTPARYVEQVRLEAARRRLEDTAEPIAAVAAACGFGTAETMRRAFLRALEVGPAEYRRRFSCPTQSKRRQCNEHRDPALRPVHRARRGRPLRGAQPAAGREGHVRRRAGRPEAHRQRQLALTAERSLAELQHPDIVLVPGGPGEAALMDDGPVLDWLRAAHETQHVDDLGLHRLADPRRRRPADGQARDQPLAGAGGAARARRRGRPRAGGVRRQARHRRRACRRASTWRSRSRRGSRASRSRRRSSWGSSTTRSRRSTPARPRRRRRRSSSAACRALFALHRLNPGDALT